jgi:hypothetical protein
MCVIMIVKDSKVRPPYEMLDRAWARNDDGAGFAWREKTAKGTIVKWKKGIDDFDKMFDLSKTLPTPYILHLRLASIGGLRKELTQPFPLDARLDLEGSTDGYVHFHNGTWDKWADVLLTIANERNIKLPRGKWNDSRAFAFLAGTVGEGFMEFVADQRGLLFGPRDYELFWGKGWKLINDISCSNDDYITKGSRYSECMDLDCKRKDRLDREGHCPYHTNIGEKELKPVPRIQEVSKVEPTPFHHANNRQSVTPGPIRTLLTVAVAEALFNNNKLSRNKLKDVRKWWSRMGLSTIAGDKAQAKLTELTVKLYSDGRLK